jgi:hypothetical protein
MTIGSIYGRLLWLYPAEFRKQFSQEMLSVFEQKASERSANRRAVPFGFLLIEFTSIVQGAYVMWLKQILSMDRNGSPSDSPTTVEPAPDYEEATKQRSLAIQNMVAAIAKHDFVAARRYSYEEVRLKVIIDREVLVSAGRLA